MELQHLSIHGHDVGFHTAGSGSSVVVLIHGMAASSGTWSHVIPALAEQVIVVAPDLLGHGQSSKPRSDYSIGGYACGIRDLLIALGYERVTVVGHSLGGGVALQFAYQFPDRCERLVLLGSGGLGREVAPLLRALTFPGAEYLFPLVFWPGLHDAGMRLARSLRRLGLRATPVLEEIWRGYASLTDAGGRQAFVHTLRSVIDLAGQRVNATDRLYLASEVPTLIVWGKRDSIIPVDHAIAAHAAIPGSRLEVFDGVGHYPHCEEPERFARVLLDFIHSTPPAAASERRWREVLLRSLSS